MIDYAVHYVKSSGGTSKKVFKLKETELQPGETLQIVKKQSFQDLTTRKHYAGKHLLEIIVNGKVLGSKDFRLTI